MTITLEIPVELEERLQQAAARLGQSVPAYLLGLAENDPGIGLTALVPLKDTHEEDTTECSLLELEGLGADQWRQELGGLDAQEYVDTLRDEWEYRP